MRTAAILPVKRFADAKRRLAASVTDELRRELAAAMVVDVLNAIASTRLIERTIIVTREPSLVPLAREHGAICIADGGEHGQSAAAALGVRAALEQGFERALCVPGDCPALAAGELDALLEAHEGEQAHVVVVPDRHGTGTNGLLLFPPDAIPPSFGPGSCARHRALAHADGMSCRLEPLPSLLLDIDTGADLEALRLRLDKQPGGASSTRAVLGRDERPALASSKTHA